MANLTSTEWIVASATIAGPILAVQAQKLVERITETRRRKLQIFRILMSTRATRLSAEHVQALNMIDLEFFGANPLGLFRYQSTKEKTVVASWRSYRDILFENMEKASESQVTDWTSRSFSGFIDLLFALSAALGYNFDKVHLKRAIYSPRAHSDIEAAQVQIRDSLVKILSGQESLSMKVTDFPVSQEALDLQMKLQTAFLASLSGEKPIKVSVESTPTTEGEA